MDASKYVVEHRMVLDEGPAWLEVGVVLADYAEAAAEQALGAGKIDLRYGGNVMRAVENLTPGRYRVFEPTGYSQPVYFDVDVDSMLVLKKVEAEEPSPVEESPVEDPPVELADPPVETPAAPDA